MTSTHVYALDKTPTECLIVSKCMIHITEKVIVKTKLVLGQILPPTSSTLFCYQQSVFKLSLIPQIIITQFKLLQICWF